MEVSRARVADSSGTFTAAFVGHNPAVVAGIAGRYERVR